MSAEGHAHDSMGGIDAKVRLEQLRISVEQVRRIPPAHFLLDVFIAGTGWHAGVPRFAAAWLVFMTVCQVGRSVYAVRAYRKRALSPDALLMRLSVLLTCLGAIHAVFVAVIFHLPATEARYVLTMILVGNAAGAVSPAAGHVRSYLSWAALFGGTLAACWLSEGTVEGASIALLIVLLFGILTMYVRDQGRTLRNLVELTESLREARDVAERAGEAKTRFFSAASHDLRQPLTALAYNAAALHALSTQQEDDTLASISDGIRRSLKESQGLLDSLLEVSQLEAKAVQASWSSVDVGALLSEMHESFAPLAEERGLSLDLLGTTGQRPFANTDPELLRRVVRNLVGNALKFTERGGVTVSVRLDDEQRTGLLRILVKDTGPGIPPELHARIFEEFFQVGNPERDRSHGLGLGLSIVRRIATLLNASVSVSSEVGTGTEFEVVLAQGWIERGSEKPVSRAVEPPDVFGMAARRVLLVDDERDIREGLMTFLGTLGWDVRTADGTAAALSALEAGFDPEALIVDFRLRDGESGLEVLAAVRALGCVAPAWLITGDTSPARIAEARVANIPVIYKPIDGVELVAAVDAFLADRSRGQL